MRFGIWSPLPHTIRPEPRVQQAITELSTRGSRARGSTPPTADAPDLEGIPTEPNGSLSERQSEGPCRVTTKLQSIVE